MNMEKSNFEDSMHVEVSSSESKETLENLEERLEVLQGIVDEFDSGVGSVLKEYLRSAEVTHSEERGFDDSIKLKNLTEIVSKLSTFEEHIKSLVNLFESKDGADGINILLVSVMDLRKQLSVAPDVRYSLEAQIEKHGGKENIPAERCLDNFEHTQELIVSLKGEIKGIRGALRFMSPTKINQ
jgi:hypothetical protein